MQYTENYSLRKPQIAETASVSDINYNSDRIDAIMLDNRQISVAMYVSGNTYNTGDIVGYENPSTHRIRAYRCLVDNVTGTWDSTKWALTNLAAEIIDAKQSGGTEVIANPTGTAAGTLNTVEIDDVIYEVGGDSANQNIADAFSELQTYAVGDYCIYESILYKCTTAVTTAGAWDSTKWESCVVTDEMGQGGGGSSTFAGLSDVNITNPVSGQVPCYDATTQKWVNATGGSSPAVVYHADWIASSVSTINAALTDAVTLPKGKYLAIINFPYSTSNDQFISGLYLGNALDYTTLVKAPLNYGRSPIYFELTEPKQVYYASGATATYTWDSQYLDRGGMDIIDITWLGGTGIQPVIYSEDEREIGVWTDGKPLYQKTIIITTSPTYDAWNTVPCGDVYIVDIEGIYVRTNNSVDYFTYYESATAGLYVSQRADNIAYKVTSAYSTNFQKMIFTIKYTKTADAAGSGIWTPSGVPAVHYSTSEHIVGTWIDGKTVYEKTIDFGALPNNTSKSVAHGISNLDYIVNDAVVAKSNSGSIIPIPFNHRSNLSSQVQLSYDATNIIIATGADQSAYNTCYVTLQYTKSSS